MPIGGLLLQAFLVSLFLAQRFGTGRVSSVFAPITFLWLALVGVTGVMNIVQHPGVFRAVDPSRAILCKACRCSEVAG